MAEKGAQPNISRTRRALLGLTRTFTSPLQIDHYIEMINPMWSTLELRGKVVEIKRETGNAATIVIKPSHPWPGHEAGQYIRVGFEIDGIWNWRAYSLTSEPECEDGLLRITPKVFESGKVSPHLNQKLEPGTMVKIGQVEGTFHLPDPAPDKILFVSAGSGITPVMAMLRSLGRRDELANHDIVHLHSARDADDVIFGDELRSLDSKYDNYKLHEQHTGSDGRLSVERIRELCPDWRERETFACGPAEMLDALTEAWEAEGEEERIHMERFQPRIGGDGEGEGGTILFTRSECETSCDGSTPILEAGEEAGIGMPFGCRMGICHTCTLTLVSGTVRDLRNGDEFNQPNEPVQTCVTTAVGDCTLDI